MGEQTSTDPVGERPHRPWLAAVLSFVLPGAGQAYAGRLRAAAILALPMLVLIVLGAAVIVGALELTRNTILSTRFLIAVLVLNVIVFGWRSGAIVHAGLAMRPDGARLRRRTIGAVGLLLAATLAMHAWVGVVVVQLEGTLTEVFGGTDPGRNPDSSAPPAPSQAPGEPEPTPLPHWDGTERLNILLLGTDAAPGREAVLTDVILLVSIDPVEETAVMVSVPRDTGFVPLPDRSVHADALYPDKMNGLMATAAADPATWCPDLDDDPQACGLRTIETSAGLYLGVEIHHYALVDMAGFAELIDAVGGLELCLPGQLVDPEFDGSLENEEVTEPLVLPAGCHQYNGLDALAYARSRKGWIEMPDGERVPQTDFTRNDRQQLVLLALREELVEADTIIELPAVLGAISRTVSTDFPRDRAGELASLLPLITGPDIERLVLDYPDYVDLPLEPDVNYLLVPRRDDVRDAMADALGEDELRGWYLGGTTAGPPESSEEGEPPS
jgi:polyisoprenyl-teichoic acid--peptidoglycan teichoic acid transferase